MYVQDYALKRALEKAGKLIKNKEVVVVSHKDADGFLSYAVLKKVIENANIISVPILTTHTLSSIPQDFEAYVFVDIGNNKEKEIFEKFSNKVVIILDHHFSPYNKIMPKKNHININSYLFNINGDKEISATGLSYLLSKTLNRYTFDGYFYLCVGGAFSDMQLSPTPLSYNAIFLSNALARGEISKEKTLALPARSIKPLYKSIQFLMQEYGVEFSSYDSLLFLKKIGIYPYKIDFIKKTAIKAEDLNEEEIIKLSTYLAIELQKHGIREKEILKETYIIKNKYLLSEFVTLVNACVKLNHLKEGLKLSLEMKNVYNIYEKYAQEIGKAYTKAYNNITTINNRFSYYIFKKNELKDSSLTGTIATMLNKKLSSELIMIGYSNDDIIKYSLRSKEKNIGEIIRTLNKRIESAQGNGHYKAGGGIIAEKDLKMFIEHIISLLGN